MCTALLTKFSIIQNHNISPKIDISTCLLVDMEIDP